MPPRMIVIAGPPGGGKSAIFPISTFGIDAFNADDQAAELNAGSYRNISMEIRDRVNRDMEVFVATHIGSKTSFAIETTLRTGITFLQAKAAQAAGFQVDMLYIALRDFAAHVKRVKARAFAGGHSAPADRLREIHRLSLANLAEAIQTANTIQVFDNSGFGVEPLLLLEAASGEICYRAECIPDWLTDALHGTAYDLDC